VTPADPQAAVIGLGLERDMGGGEGHVEEERSRSVPADEVCGLGGEGVGQVARGRHRLGDVQDQVAGLLAEVGMARLQHAEELGKALLPREGRLDAKVPLADHAGGVAVRNTSASIVSAAGRPADLSRVTLSTDGIPLGQDSSVFDPQRRDRRIMLSDDFGHLPQVQQERIKTLPNIIQRRTHGATLLAARPASQHFRLPGRARVRDHPGPQVVPCQTLER
jgi:hypothetical protein